MFYNTTPPQKTCYIYLTSLTDELVKRRIYHTHLNAIKTLSGCVKLSRWCRFSWAVYAGWTQCVRVDWAPVDNCDTSMKSPYYICSTSTQCQWTATKWTRQTTRYYSSTVHGTGAKTRSQTIGTFTRQ